MFIKSIQFNIRDYFRRPIIKVRDIGKIGDMHVVIHKELYKGKIQNKTYKIWNDHFYQLSYKYRNKDGKFDRLG